MKRTSKNIEHNQISEPVRRVNRPDEYARQPKRRTEGSDSVDRLFYSEQEYQERPLRRQTADSRRRAAQYSQQITETRRTSDNRQHSAQNTGSAPRTQRAEYDRRERSAANQKKIKQVRMSEQTLPVRAEKNTPKKKKKGGAGKVFIILLPILIVLLGLTVFLASELSVAKNHASSIKDEVGTFLECVEEKDAAGAKQSLENLYQKTDELDELLHSGFWKTASKVGKVKKELDAADQLIDILREVEDTLLTPLVSIMGEYPLDQLKVGDGFNVKLILVYINFLEEAKPILDDLLAKMEAMDATSLVGGTVADYKVVMYEALDAYAQASEMLPLVKAFLGNGSDRLYILAAQNSAEIRASGGFPGSMGTIQIKDGIMTIGDFESVYAVLSSSISYESNIDELDFNLFGSWIGAPRDACFIPEFRKTGQVWAVAYQDRKRENSTSFEWNTPEDQWVDENGNGWNDVEERAAHVDGVVSLTPAIIQALLTHMDPITLSDGTVLDGTNATKILQHDLYLKYFNTSSESSDEELNSVADTLFAETAKMVMKNFVASFELATFDDFYQIIKDGMKKRIVQMWMANEEEEQLIVQIGASGALSVGEDPPVAGVYFSLADPCKMGWYLDILTEISEPVLQEDGTRLYDVKVTLNNTIPEEEIQQAGYYILGDYNGAIRGFVHCFAPEGASLINVNTSNWMYMIETQYHGLEVAYNLDLVLYPYDPVEITYQIIVPAGIETPLEMMTTPTLTEYR